LGDLATKKEMAFAIGSLVLANYTAKIKDTQTPIETTVEEEAKKLGIHDPSKRYEPRLIAVGEGWVLKGVDEAIQNAESGQKMTVEIPPEKAFGVRDPSRVRLIPIRKFGDKADDLEVGSEVEVDNRVGVVRFLGSGRAQVDFNHRYAGKTIVYDIEVVKALESQEEKVKALIKRRLPIDDEKLNYELHDSKVTVKLPSDLYLVEGLQILKKAIAQDIFKYANGPTLVEFVESYEAPKPNVPPQPREKVEETRPPSPEEEEKSPDSGIVKKEEEQSVSAVPEEKLKRRTRSKPTTHV
jgi:peptidylprolyl isomerase